MDVPAPLTDRYIYLTGRPSIREFATFIKRHGLDSQRQELLAQWRASFDYVRELEEKEKGYADGMELRALPEEFRLIADMETESIARMNNWQGLRYSWQLVELDRLVVFQKTVNLRFVSEVMDAIPSNPNMEDAIRLATGKTLAAAPVRVTRSEEFTFVCVSPSNDVRVLEIEQISPDRIEGYKTPGHPAVVIGICVGYSANGITATQVNGRLILTNGSHRAFALRQRGFTHAPCLVLSLSRDDEMDLKLPDEVRVARDLFLRAPRPSVFKDYFDHRAFATLDILRINHMIQFQIGYQRIGMASV